VPSVATDSSAVWGGASLRESQQRSTRKKKRREREERERGRGKEGSSGGIYGARRFRGDFGGAP